VNIKNFPILRRRILQKALSGANGFFDDHQIKILDLSFATWEGNRFAMSALSSFNVVTKFADKGGNAKRNFALLGFLCRMIFAILEAGQYPKTCRPVKGGTN
jgi:hypothetical protein